MSSGQKAKTLLELLLGRYVALHDSLEFVTCVKCDNVPGLDRDCLAGPGVAAGRWRLAPDVEVAEARHLDVVARNQRRVDQLKERLHHVLRFALVEPEPLKQQFGKLRLRERRSFESRQ